MDVRNGLMYAGILGEGRNWEEHIQSKGREKSGKIWIC